MASEPNKAGQVLQRRLRHLKEISPITWFFERIFYGLSCVSPERLVAPSRVEIQNQYQKIQDRRRASRSRGRIIEGYILTWIAVEVFLVVYVALQPARWGFYCSAIIMGLRVLDILQITVNISIFDRMRLIWRDHYHESVPRSLILAVLNYGELIACFSVIYALLRLTGQLNDAEKVIDAYYFSAVTQLTIGYGDIRPHGIAKLVAVFQGFLGYLFTILILSRIVNMLPEIQSQDP